MRTRRIGVVLLVVLAGAPTSACWGGGFEEAEMWQQLFTTWSCTAEGRADFAFEAIQLSDFGSDHEWVDLETDERLPAYVSTTDAYLKNADDSAFRNFTLVPNDPDVLDHLEEWTVTAGADDPYRCTTP